LKILCIGAGAIGICIGGSLAGKGAQVYFLVKTDQQGKLAGKELAVYYKENAVKIKNLEWVTNQDDLKELGKFDCVMIAVKAFDTDEVIKQLTKSRIDFNSIICLQNGVENEEKFKSAFPDKGIIGVSIVSAVSKLDETSVRIEKNRGIGLSGRGPEFEEFFTLLDQAGLKPKKYNDLSSMKWSKMVSNLFSNAASAILDMSPLEVYSRPKLFLVEKAQIMETIAVMQKMGLKVQNLPGLPLRLLVGLMQVLPNFILRPLLIQFVAKGRGDKMPSFYIEKMKGSRRSEVNYLNGAVARFGANYGINTPVNKALTAILNEVLDSAESKHRYSRHPELLERTILSS